MVQEFLGRLRRDGVGDASIVKTAAVLHSIMNRAVIGGLIEHNAVSVVCKPSQRRKPEGSAFRPRKNPAPAGLLRIAGAGVEPATFGL
jgi:hypothetical protein